MFTQRMQTHEGAWVADNENLLHVAFRLNGARQFPVIKAFNAIRNHVGFDRGLAAKAVNLVRAVRWVGQDWHYADLPKCKTDLIPSAGIGQLHNGSITSAQPSLCKAHRERAR